MRTGAPSAAPRLLEARAPSGAARRPRVDAPPTRRRLASPAPRRPRAPRPADRGGRARAARVAAVLALAGLAAASVLWLASPPPAPRRSPPATGATQATRHAPIPPAELAPSSAPPPARPPGLAGDWHLVFDDEFSGSALDTARWSTCYDWGCTNEGNPETEWYEAANVAVGGGVASLTARPGPAAGRPFTSGLIQTSGHFAFEHGYVEVRAELPTGTGLWPAVWMLPADHAFPPEIDLFEVWGSNPDQAMLGVHDRPGSHPHAIVEDPSLSTGYHTFAVDWEPTSITWYVDGVRRFEAEVSVSTPMYLIADLATLGTPSTDVGTRWPASLRLDYVRVWQRR